MHYLAGSWEGPWPYLFSAMGNLRSVTFQIITSSVENVSEKKRKRKRRNKGTFHNVVAVN
jgi:hypothetical protein